MLEPEDKPKEQNYSMVSVFSGFGSGTLGLDLSSSFRMGTVDSAIYFLAAA